MAENSGDAALWKNVALFLAGCVLSGIGTIAAMAHDSIPRAEVNQMIHDIYAQMDHRDQLLSDRLSRIEQSQAQMGKDVGNIAGQLRVPASPVTPH